MWRSLLISQPHYSIFLDAAQQHFQVIFGSKVGEGIRKQEDIQEEKHMRTLSRTHQQETVFFFFFFFYKSYSAFTSARSLSV